MLFRLLCVAAILWSAVLPVSAAELYFTPDRGAYAPGETVTAELRLEPIGECVNAAQIIIRYPHDLLEPIDASRSDSIFPLWVVPPVVRTETSDIVLAGGVPGGYCGRTPGDPAVSNVIAKLVFRFRNDAATPAEAELTLGEGSHATLADGFGTDAPLTFRRALFQISLDAEPHENEWTRALAEDTTPPEPFTFEIVSDPRVFGGKYVAVFSTTDKQTGLDRYEILETRDPADADRKNAPWQAAVSPYLLRDQSLGSFIFVRAVDEAGNARVASYRPEPLARTANDPWVIFGLSAMFLWFAVAFWLRKVHGR